MRARTSSGTLRRCASIACVARWRMLRSASGLAERAERVLDRRRTRCSPRREASIASSARSRHFLVLARGEQRAAAAGSSRPRSRGFRAIACCTMLIASSRWPLGVEDPGLRDQRPRAGRAASAVARSAAACARSHPHRLAAVQVVIVARRRWRSRRRRARSPGRATRRSRTSGSANSRSCRVQRPRVALAAQVEVVGLQVLGRLGRERLLLLRRQRDAQRLGDLARDLVLHLEHVLHLAVVALGPERESPCARP